MNKTLNVIIGALAGILFAIPAISAYETKTATSTTLNAYALNSAAEATLALQATSIPSPSTDTEQAEVESTVIPELVAPENDAKKNDAISKTDANNNAALSRGGVPAIPAEKSVQAKPTETKKAKTELLDWWKDARHVFARGDVVTVKDLYTGKTFKVERTMGTNHADAEALTANDTKIIKEIWGGFSWDRRPVHIYIDGRVLAASMSAMPHAGIDSAPAYAYVKNRSDGYGSGENLDVIKGNNMDGHFDIHFLNSTRHKDGDKDSEHQSMIKIASQK